MPKRDIKNKRVFGQIASGAGTQQIARGNNLYPSGAGIWTNEHERPAYRVPKANIQSELADIKIGNGGCRVHFRLIVEAWGLLKQQENITESQILVVHSRQRKERREHADGDQTQLVGWVGEILKELVWSW